MGDLVDFVVKHLTHSATKYRAVSSDMFDVCALRWSIRASKQNGNSQRSENKTQAPLVSCSSNAHDYDSIFYMTKKKRQMVRLKFPNHMQDRIQDRNLNVDHVRLAIREPDWTKEVLQGKMKVCKKIDENTSIRVVYYKDGFRDTNDYMVITAYYTPSC
jgi:hypothetical protein